MVWWRGSADRNSLLSEITQHESASGILLICGEGWVLPASWLQVTKGHTAARAHLYQRQPPAHWQSVGLCLGREGPHSVISCAASPSRADQRPVRACELLRWSCERAGPVLQHPLPSDSFLQPGLQCRQVLPTVLRMLCRSAS